MDAGFAGLNGMILVYATTVYMGWRNVIADLWVAMPGSLKWLHLQRQWVGTR